MMHPNPWQLLDQKTVADCRVFTVNEHTFSHPAKQKTNPFYVIDCNDWVQVLALTEQRELILVNQFRFGSRDFSWEVPGGVIDPEDKDPVAAGCRELLEETGYAGEHARCLGWVHPNPAIMSNKSHFVLVENCREIAPPSPDEHEELETKRIPVSEAFAMLKAGQIKHSITINALFFLQMNQD